MAKVKAAILAEPKGLDVATVTDLRKKFREAQIDYKVVKNTLAQRAAKGTPLEPLVEKFVGPDRAHHVVRRRGGAGEDPGRFARTARSFAIRMARDRGEGRRRPGHPGAGQDARAARAARQDRERRSRSRPPGWCACSGPPASSWPRCSARARSSSRRQARRYVNSRDAAGSDPRACARKRTTKTMADLNTIVDQLVTLTVMEAAELVKKLEEKWGVSRGRRAGDDGRRRRRPRRPRRSRRRPSSRSSSPRPAPTRST